MMRRRRPQKEIAFSFDSFLDLVANVVGIIIRLILIVWVGARSYTGIIKPEVTPAPAAAAKAAAEDPLEPELARSRQELEDFWRSKLEEVQDRYKAATEEYRRLLGKYPRVCLRIRIAPWPALAKRNPKRLPNTPAYCGPSMSSSSTANARKSYRSRP